MKTKSDKPTNVRLTPEAKRLLQELAKALGVTQTAAIEIAIRRFAGVTPSSCAQSIRFAHQEYDRSF